MSWWTAMSEREFAWKINLCSHGGTQHSARSAPVHAIWFAQCTQHDAHSTHNTVHTAWCAQCTQHSAHSMIRTVHTTQCTQCTQHDAYSAHSMMHTSLQLCRVVNVLEGEQDVMSEHSESCRKSTAVCFSVRLVLVYITVQHREGSNQCQSNLQELRTLDSSV